MPTEDQWTAEDRSRWSTYVQDWLRARRMTRAQAAEVLGLSGSALTQWCKHGDRPSLTNAEAFGERIGAGADEGRRMSGYSAATTESEAPATMEQVFNALREQNEAFREEVNAKLDLILEANPTMRARMKEVMTQAQQAKPGAPPL